MRCYVRIVFTVTLFLLSSALILLINRLDSHLYEFDAKPYFFSGFGGNNKNNEIVRNPKMQVILNKLKSPAIHIPPTMSGHSDKYMLLNISLQECGRSGNHLFRSASMYGVASHLKRKACLHGQCFEGKPFVEMNPAFPNLHKYIHLGRCWKGPSKLVGVYPPGGIPPKKPYPDFASNIWRYDNISKLEQYDNETYISFNDTFFQSHKFFHPVRKTVLKMFEFSDAIKKKVDNYVEKLFGDQSSSTKVCAHIRQGDFKTHFMLTSSEQFTMMGLDYLVYKAEVTAHADNVAVLLLSDDAAFATSVANQMMGNGSVGKAVVSQGLTPLQDIALAARHCDYFLLPSSGSTFSWWMAYLMPDDKQRNIYYNSRIFKKKAENPYFLEGDYFPPEWQRLYHDLERNILITQDRSIPPVVS